MRDRRIKNHEVHPSRNRGALIIFSSQPAYGQILFESKGGSLAPFICDYGQVVPANASINSSDGQGVPSIEFDSPNLTMRRAAPYMILAIQAGRQFNASLDFKMELDHVGYVTLGFFGVPTDSTCSFPSWPGGRWPIPAFGYQASAERVDWIVSGPSGVANIVQPDGSLPLTKGEWHRAHFQLTVGANDIHPWEFRIDSQLVASGDSYDPLDTPIEAGVEIGTAGSGAPSHMKFDNITIQVRDAGHFATEVLDHSATPFSAAVVLGAPAGPGTDFDGNPGYVTVAFEDIVANGLGDDLLVHLTGFQPGQQFIEDFFLDASEDGVTFVQIGYANPNDFSFGPSEIVQLPFDLAAGGIATAQSIRLRNAQVFSNTSSEGPDVIAFEAIHQQPPDSEGPKVSAVVAAPSPVEINTATTLMANVDDSTTGGSTIASAEYTLDGGTGVDMAASDAPFDQVAEDVTAVIPGQDAGVYEICVNGTDGAGNTGNADCILLPVYDPTGGFVTGGGWVETAPNSVGG